MGFAPNANRDIPVFFHVVNETFTVPGVLARLYIAFAISCCFVRFRIPTSLLRQCEPNHVFSAADAVTNES